MLITSEDISKILSKNVKKARKKLGYTQEYVAENLNISIDLLRNIESGRSLGSITTILNICNFLQVSPNTLFSELLNFKENTLDTTLISYMDSLSKKDKNLLKQIIIHMDKNY